MRGSARRFDILSSFCTDEHRTEKWLQECTRGVMKSNKCVSCDHRSRECEPLVGMSAICALVFPSESVPTANTVSLGNMSHGRALAFYGHLDKCVIILENRLGRTLAGSVCNLGDKIKILDFLLLFVVLLTVVVSFWNVASSRPVLVVQKHRKNYVPQVYCKNSIWTKTSIQRNEVPL